MAGRIFVRHKLNIMKSSRYKLIFGAVDAVTSTISHSAGADYIWASSFILSAMMGKKDDGITNIKTFSHHIKSISMGSNNIIFDFDIGGKNIRDLGQNLKHLVNHGVYGVCIEDESYPKVNAMLGNTGRRLLEPHEMAKKIHYIKSKNVMKIVIARTHSMIINEQLGDLQKRILAYEDAGADALAIHYTGSDWRKYAETMAKLNISKPLVIILSKELSLPPEIDKIKGVEYLVFPNQLYREMIGRAMLVSKNNIYDGSFWQHITTTDHIFNLVDGINKNLLEGKNEV